MDGMTFQVVFEMVQKWADDHNGSWPTEIRLSPLDMMAIQSEMSPTHACIVNGAQNLSMTWFADREVASGSPRLR